MSKWKRAAAGLIVFVMIFQCAVSYTVAADDNATELLHDRNTVLIDLLQNDGLTPHFVREYPSGLELSQLAAEPPAEPAAREVYDEIPGFVQEEYPYALYGNGTVASCGSSITALAMAATYLTGYTYLPDELARSFAGKADTDVERIQYAAGALGLVYTEPGVGNSGDAGEAVSEAAGTTVDKWSEILAALEEGKCAIVELNAGSLFAEEKHFVVLKGIAESSAEDGTESSTEDSTEEDAEIGGRILVLDPCGANYKKEALQEGFASGFDASVISGALGNAWIFDRSAMPGDIPRYEEYVGGESVGGESVGGESVGEKTGKRYADLELTPVEKQLLARAVSVLGKGECVEGQQVVVEVLLNRLLSEEFPGKVKELVYGKNGLCDVNQLNEAEVTQAEYTAVSRALYGPYILNEGVTDLTYTCHE